MSTIMTLETIEIKLPADVLRTIRAEAQRRGTGADEVLYEAVTEKAALLERKPHSGMSFDEILAPVHEYARNSEETEEELEAFIDAELAAFRREINGN